MITADAAAPICSAAAPRPHAGDALYEYSLHPLEFPVRRPATCGKYDGDIFGGWDGLPVQDRRCYEAGGHVPCSGCLGVRPRASPPVDDRHAGTAL